MSDNKNPSEGSRSLPDDVAASAGMPHGPKSDHPVGSAAGGGAGPAPRTPGSTARGAHDAAGAAESLKACASDAAEEARERVSAAVRDARGRAGESYSEARSWAADMQDEQRRRISDLADRGADRLQEGRTAVERFVSENPLLVGVVGLAAGLLLGALLPRTRQEDRTVGPWADEVRDQGLRYARDVTSRGRDFVESALDPSKLDRAPERDGGTSQQGGGARANAGGARQNEGTAQQAGAAPGKTPEKPAAAKQAAQQP